MTILEIPETGRKFYVPSNLGECDRQQYIDICELMYRFNTAKIDYTTFANQAIYKLLNLMPAKKYKSEAIEQEKNANISILSGIMLEYFEARENDETKTVIKQDYVHNHIPFVQPLWKKYYGPTNEFRNISFGEYTDAINLFLEYEKTRNEAYLPIIMAIFYRKKRKFHLLKKLFGKHSKDVREPYNSDTVDKRVKVFEGLTMGEKYGFYLFLASFHKYLTQCKLRLNGNEINIGYLFKEPSKKVVTSNLPGIGLKSIEYQISESGVFGTNQEVRATNLWEILIRLYDLTKRNEDEEARHEADKRAAKQKK